MWFAKDHEDGRTDRILRVTSKDSIESGIILRSNLNRKFYEDHLWLSIIFRRCRSSYTRVQRLSTAWALLFLTMIANCMWFKSADEETNDEVGLSIGPISLTVYQLYASVVSSLMVVPAILIITWCYMKACPKSEDSACTGPYLKHGTASPDGEGEEDTAGMFMDEEDVDQEDVELAKRKNSNSKSTQRKSRPKGKMLPLRIVCVACVSMCVSK